MVTLTYIAQKSITTFLRTAIGLLVTNRAPPSPDSVLQIPSRDAGRTIKAHVYKCSKPPSSGPTPVLLTYHGSGFMLPGHGSDEGYCKFVSSSTRYTVIDISYRLSPEHPFPAALNDVEDTVKYVLSKPDVYDVKNISIGGFSAGATLSLACCTLFPSDTFKSIVAFYPVTDISMDDNARVPPSSKGRPIPAFLTRLFWWCYLPPTLDRRDPRISPHFADAACFPKKMLLVTCAQDSLCLEAEELADRIKKDNDQVHVRKLRVAADHGWNVYPMEEGSDQASMRDEAYTLVKEMLDEE